jgi:Icc-related predicted phosphoesterase
MGDILVHAGDLSQYGTFAEIQAQLEWLASQPHPHKIVIPGNHDLLLDSHFVITHAGRELDKHPGNRRSDLKWGGIHYLEHGLIELFLEEKDRSIRVFGSPWTPKFGSFAFQYGEMFTWADSVPVGTDVMLVHGPPKGHLDDGGKGCEKLLAELWRARPKVVVCGHIHAGRGEERLLFDRSQAAYENVILGRRPWISVLSLTLCFIWNKLRRVAGFGPSSSCERTKSTYLVNAAMVGGRGNSERRDAIVVTV